MTEILSSSSTKYYKLYFPIFWILVFGQGTFLLWAGKFNQPSPPPEEMKYIFLMVLVAGSAFILRDAFRLKTVSIDGDSLIIKDFKKVINVPLRSVSHISESRLVNPKTISLTLYPTCDFGEKIVFIPKKVLHNPFGEHPVVKRLRELTHLHV